MERERVSCDDPWLLSDDPSGSPALRKTHQRLIRLAVSRGVDLDSANDLAQDAFRLLLECRTVVTNPDAWLVRIVLRRSCDFWRQREIELRALSRMAMPEGPPERSDPIRRRRLTAALLTLPLKSRMLIRSRYFEGHDEATAARAAGYSPASFKKVMTRALAQLRRALRSVPPKGQTVRPTANLRRDRPEDRGQPTG